MNIVFMGTPDFAVYSLRALAESEYSLTGVVTQPDRPKGRKKEPVWSPVKAEAVKYGIPVLQPVRVRRNPEAYEALREMAPDLIVVAAFGQIIPKEILELPRFGCINVHASLLPAYRGAAPIQHAILDGAERTGVTIMQMSEGLDTGDMISSWETEIRPDDTGGSLFDRLAEEGAKLLLETLPSIFDGTAVRTPQPAESTTAYAAMITRESGRIDFKNSAARIERQVRAMNPWPAAWTTLDGKNLKIWKARAEAGPEAEGDVCGSFSADPERGIAVRTGDGILFIEELQMEGRRRMTAKEFLRGRRPGSDRLPS